MTTLVGLDLTGRRVLVVGGGQVAARRLPALVAASARVVVVTEVATTEVAALAATGRVELVERRVVEADVDGAWLVHTCTGDAVVDAQVARWAEQRRTFCVVASRSEAGSARFPATTTTGDVVVGVTSAGAPDPRRAAGLRDAIADLLLTGALSARRHRAGGTLAPGSVALVGGGPGDPDLMTVRARSLLAQADVVVADRLGPTSVLSELGDEVEVVHVGKSPGAHQVPQGEIEEILVRHARAGRRVVRLKGGDPFLFGRGGEEVLACRRAGVPVTVVPGVTTAVAAPALGGIPVTHRGTADRVHVVNGHGDLRPADLAALASTDTTVVVLMGVAGLARLSAQATAAGVDPATPAAVVSHAGLPQQRTVRARLDQIARVCAEEGVRSPGVVVVGGVAREDLLVPDLAAGPPDGPVEAHRTRELVGAPA
ncbi:uroporphyrinogen-III C-methyltransferase [Actinotalea solisilvae]|uniref:uroporphyrinogen-III C-methyltransferase n=1 Tax=Actinotalea solisilvae TaxID=2072922 RepID=UPI0018F1D1D7|nr:uroporphyrinogen-III C-methyltransferase [Actinotalea solisilvae]